MTAKQQIALSMGEVGIFVAEAAVLRHEFGTLPTVPTTPPWPWLFGAVLAAVMALIADQFADEIVRAGVGSNSRRLYLVALSIVACLVCLAGCTEATVGASTAAPATGFVLAVALFVGGVAIAVHRRT